MHTLLVRGLSLATVNFTVDLGDLEDSVTQLSVALSLVRQGFNFASESVQIRTVILYLLEPSTYFIIK